MRGVYNLNNNKIWQKELTELKIAIVYATVGGTTRECASLLKNELKNHDVTLFEIGKNEPDLEAFDLVVLGFPIIMGKAVKCARNFIKTYAEQLKNSKTAYFICCGFVDCFEEYAEKCIPKELADAAVDISCLGGSLDPTKFRGLNRIVVKAVRDEILGGGDNADERKDMVLPTIMEENIAQFAEKIKNSVI